MATKILSPLKFTGALTGPMLRGINSGDSLLANLTLVVSSGGNDSDPTRPVVSAGGDLSAYPFATRQAAVDAVPKSLGPFTAEIQDSLTTAESVYISGFTGSKLKITGSSSSMDSLTIEGNAAVVELNTFSPGTVTGDRNKRIDFLGMTLSNAVTLNDTDHVVFDASTTYASPEVHLNGGSFADISGTHSDSYIVAEGFRKVVCHLVADSNSSAVLRAMHCGYVGHEITATNCTATVLELVNCSYTEPIDAGLTGTNASAPFAVSISGGGHHVLTGTTMTGTNDLDFDGYTISWTALSTENYFSGGTAAFWADAFWVMLGSFRVINNSSNDFDDFRVRDLQFSRFFKQYGADRALPTTNVGIGDYTAGAYAEIIAHSGGGQSSAFLIGLQQTNVYGAGADGDSVRFFNDTTEAPGTGFGTHGEIWNTSNHSVDLFPPTGKHIIFNGTDLGANNACALPVGTRVNWLTDSNGNWYVASIPLIATAAALGFGTAAVGTSRKFAAEDHVHPASWSGATGTNSATFPDNLAEALWFGEGSNRYLQFVSTNGAEGMVAAKPLAVTKAAVAAAGSSQGTATPITSQLTVVTSGNENGLLLPPNRPAGEMWAVLNLATSSPDGSANYILVYPSSGETIDPLSANAFDLLGNVSMGLYFSTGSGHWRVGILPIKTDNVSIVHGRETHYFYTSVFLQAGLTSSGILTLNTSSGGIQNNDGHLIFGNASTGVNQITFPDNYAEGLWVGEGSNRYLTFVSTNGSELIKASKNFLLDACQVYQTIPSTLTTGGTTITVDWNNGNAQVIDLQGATGTVTLSYSNAKAGATYALKIIQGSTARNITWPSGTKWPGGLAPTISTANDAIDLVTIFADEASNYLSTFQQAYA